MGYYFDHRDSAAWLLGNQPEKIVRLMASKYMGDNPAVPYVWRSWNQSSIQSNRKGGYEFNFNDRFPDGNNGDVAYAIGELFCPDARSSNFLVSCYGPVTIWLNQERIFVSNGNQEREGLPVKVGVSLRNGYNRFLIRCERTSIGFGCILQNAMPQWEPCNYVTPFEERKGAAGFLFTAPLTTDELEVSSCWGLYEKDTRIAWLPENTGKLQDKGNLYYAWTQYSSQADIDQAMIANVILVDDKKPEQGAALPRGVHSLLIYGTLEQIRECMTGMNAACQCSLPIHSHGVDECYLVLGPCEKSKTPIALPVPGVLYAHTTWRPDKEQMLLRPYVETSLFGKWTYPLGVTLYGLLSAGRLLNEAAYVSYVQLHVAQVTSIHPYALWDTERFGFAGVNQQLCWLDALDDCGSFGSLMLECDGGKSEAVQMIAYRIAEYMLKEQPQTEDGAYCRRDQTIWVDDMYMSVPFLCRYSNLFSDPAGTEMCVRQLLKYKELLYMPSQKIMAHMMCLRHGKNNQIPWCRGNGWVIFSLSELLMTLSENHPQREQLITFYQELTKGYLALQGEEGLWHQILDDETTYPESSSTAMMICAFCRGIRMGLYPEQQQTKVIEAIRKAWKGLTEVVIDRHGNLYGVCQGSGFSFSRAYYRTLSWKFNDTHGIGIVMLAGTEIMKTPCIGMML
jgi:rhamnogalacturonyl hydrolase YesR